jgi:Surface antigen variable number repeat/Sel1 repeat
MLRISIGPTAILLATACAHQPNVPGSRPFADRCDRGDAFACGEVGTRLSATKDYTRALPYLGRACEKNIADGCFVLGFQYMMGWGVAPDDERATRLFEKAAPLYETACTAGNATACANLGFMIASGMGATRDDALAARLLRKSCDAGITHGCEWLKSMSKEGRPSTVHFDGLHEVPESAMRNAIEIDKRNLPPGMSNQDVIARDLLLIQSVLWDYGFLESHVLEPRSEAGADGVLDVTYRVTEGVRFRLQKLEVRDVDDAGKPLVPLDGMHRTKVGEWFSRSTITEDLNDLRHAYRDAGYARVTAEPDLILDDTTRTVAVTVPVKRGAVTTFEGITVDPVGLSRTITEVARRCGVAPGATYSETSLMRAKSMLLENQNLHVVIATTDVGTDRINVSFEVH